ncbi:MAG TPA: MBL fold metallo-hydrolase [Mycobacteriales bacterium]|nr:MBL fold metallo-hydrolase [Mycobacteriales bacterium]
MIVRQFLHTTPAIGISYLFGCGSKRACCVVDPVYVPSFYLDAAESLGMQLRYVIDTHGHADHDSTGPALAAAANVPYIMHASTDAAFQFRPVADGDALEMGNTLVDVLHLPGHTPEHIGLLVTDRSRSPDPWFIVTGHTLMVGDMGRTELATSATEGAQALFQSAQRLRGLPDHVEVLPGAFAGSVCGRGLSGKATSTIGFERRHNRAFSIDDRQAFVDLMLRDIPSPPPAAAATRARNLGRRL